MFNLRRLETILLPSKAENAYSMDISSTGHIAITTSAFLLIYQIKPNKEYTGKGLYCKKYLIQPSNYTLKDDLGINIKEFIFDLPQQKYYESILTTDLTPDLEFVQPFSQRFLKCIWSPPNCDRNYDCLLATLTNNGIVEIYEKKCLENYYFEFKLVFNVSKLYIDVIKNHWGDVQKMNCEEKLNELIHRMNDVKVKCLTWSECIFNENNDDERYFILILGHLSRKVTFWKIFNENSELKINFLCEYQTNLEIISFKWKQPKNEVGFLFIGSKTGQVLTLKVIIESSSKLRIEENNPRINSDGLKIQSIHLINSKIGNFIIFVKVTSLIIISYCDKLESYEFECNNIEILDVITMDNKLLILTKTGAVKELLLEKTSNGVDIKWRHFYIDINNYMRSPMIMCASKNKALVFIITKFCKPKQSKSQVDCIDLNVFGNNESQCLERLFENPSRNLRFMWDYLELYRCYIIQTKDALLKQQFYQNYDKYDFYTLKILLYISKICDYISETLKNPLPIKSHAEISSIFHLKLILNRTQYLLNLHKKDSKLSTFHLQNLLIYSNDIKQIMTQENENFDLSDSTLDVIMDVIQRIKTINFDNIQDNCMNCGEKLDDITCIPPHFDSRCCISLMQIKTIVNFKCLLCNSIVHDEIANEMKIVTCPFCDIPMVKRLEKLEKIKTV